MPTYLLSWNPLSAFTWPNNAANSAATRRRRIVRLRWSTGGATGIAAGDRIFLGKLGPNPIGVIASGVAASDSFADSHWEDDSKRTTYNMVDFDTILDPETVLPRSRLREGPLGEVDWDAEYGGVTIPDDAAVILETKWREWCAFAGFPPVASHLERSAFELLGYAGWVKLRLHLLLEGDSQLLPAKQNEVFRRYRRLECEACRRVFADIAGSLECHDRRELSTLDSTVDLETTVQDLSLVCTECHRMLHSTGWPSVEELRLRVFKPEA